MRMYHKSLKEMKVYQSCNNGNPHKIVSMKNATLGNSVKFLLVICSLLLLSSCARKLRFENSVVVPAAEGKVKYKKDDNGNYAIDVEIRNLADPKKLTPSKNTYVLWMETDQSNVQNLGQIVSSTGWFSSTRKASLEAVTTFKPKSFFITAEDNASLTYPGTQVVLRTR